MMSEQTDFGINIKTNHKIVELREMRKGAFKINSYYDENLRSGVVIQ